MEVICICSVIVVIAGGLGLGLGDFLGSDNISRFATIMIIAGLIIFGITYALSM